MKTSYLRTPAVSTLGALALALAAQTAQANIVVDNTGANPGCSVTEVTLGGSNADYCAGYFSLGNYSPATEKAKLNAVTDGDDWSFVYKVEQGDTESALFHGIKFTLIDVNIDSVSGDWTIGWEDTDPGNAPDLPLYIDLAAGFKAGTGSSSSGIGYFLFDEFLLTNDPFSTSGTFTLSVNKGLSHEALFVRYGSTTSSSGGSSSSSGGGGASTSSGGSSSSSSGGGSSTSSGGGGASSGTGIPEPGVLALLGAGFLAQGLFLRRRRRAL